MFSDAKHKCRLYDEKFSPHEQSVSDKVKAIIFERTAC